MSAPSTDDLVVRLEDRMESVNSPPLDRFLHAEAASTIQALRAALRPFADIAETQPIAYYVGKPGDQRMVLLFDDGSKDAERAPATVMISAFRAARATIHREGGE